MSESNEIKLDPQTAESSVSTIQSAAKTLAGFNDDITDCKSDLGSWQGESGSAATTACENLSTSWVLLVAGISNYADELDNAAKTLQSTDEKQSKNFEE
ncbi:WXG100 family type VII secretion target [Bifidobacterium sp. ESL0798]|uniref:WXG100 family type VII secretion target n=1 Tax=Bifidobacterium sp. ESL0798 TaxID=2983235 RepID=UPI0023F7C2AE|nr:WXG100 family type VII secretion target [Bifidobacterium sp. ESL0798]WEV73610.1 WXG100 family type VII secretion target [Bifidobacterium sp. ESL0798]